MELRSSGKTLIIVRHAHRNKGGGRAIDNGLSSKGHRQARALAKHLQQKLKGIEHVFVTSPRKRCIETALVIAERTKMPLRESVMLLGAREEIESTKEAVVEQDALKSRVRSFCRNRRRSRDKMTVLCSHGDWIEACVCELLGVPMELKKAGYMEIQLKGGEPRLEWLVQSATDL